MMNPNRHFTVSFFFLLVLAVLAVPAASAATPPEADRAAILAMQGEYGVRFSFDETVPLAAGYARATPSRSGGDEVVILLEDHPGRIVLQHLLLHVPSGHVVKHWRQDWSYEASRRWEFAADQTWRWRDVPEELVAGSWTQCVYEVSDAPRYCGSGRWQHGNGVSTWTSDTTARPLPRRDYSKRSDYNVLMAVNRHTIVPGGWTHEQDNTKAVRNAAGEITALIVREAGFNEYRRTSAIDFSPVYSWWRATAGFWAKVRERWHARLGSTSGVRLATKIDGMALIEPLFKQAQRLVEGGSVDDAEIDAVFVQWVKPDGAVTADDDGVVSAASATP